MLGGFEVDKYYGMSSHPSPISVVDVSLPCGMHSTWLFIISKPSFGHPHQPTQMNTPPVKRVEFS